MSLYSKVKWELHGELELIEFLIKQKEKELKELRRYYKDKLVEMPPKPEEKEW